MPAMSLTRYYYVELVDPNGTVVASELGFSPKEQERLFRKMQDSDLIMLHPTATIRKREEWKDPNEQP